MRKLIRHKSFEATIELTSEQFIAPPQASQRSWLLNRAVKEFGWDLEALDQLASRFVPGRSSLLEGTSSPRDPDNPEPDDIMELWQVPIMQRMAELVTKAGGSVLEIGYGRGISAEMISVLKPRQHTIVECVPSIADACRAWAEERAQSEVRVLEGRWEEVVDQFETYDGIFFHTYPMDSEEYAQSARNLANVAEPFFEVAAKYLAPGGVFSYYSNEMDSLARPHQRALLKHFESFRVECLGDLPLPADVKDAWWIDQMIVISAYRASL